jgi:hypothetical protein
MDENYDREKLAVAKAFYQLAFYLKTLDLPFTVQDLYREAYQGQNRSEHWLDDLDEDPRLKQTLSEPFTTHTIMETLLRNGHDAVIRQLMRRVRDHGIGFAHAYVMGISRWK